MCILLLLSFSGVLISPLSQVSRLILQRLQVPEVIAMPFTLSSFLFLLLVSRLRNFHWHLWISGFQDITQWCSEVRERSFYHPNGSWAL